LIDKYLGEYLPRQADIASSRVARAAVNAIAEIGMFSSIG
jgi:hypothetical protein